MEYLSTRGGAPRASFREILIQALAPDGGLYMPADWPTLWPTLWPPLWPAAGPGSYAAAAARTLAAFAGGDLTPEEALADAVAAYDSFSEPDVVPLRPLEADLHLLELFHGPTLAFKDVAMQLLARLYERVLTRTGERLTIVCATSGDTGGAAVEAFAGSSRVRLLALFPEGRISEVQRRFMTTSAADNVAAVAVQGDFDDCQALVKALFADPALVEDLGLTGVNSINWARILAQSVYYAVACARLGGEAVFSVPTGNFGDAFAAETARRLGAPVAGVMVATNTNDIMARVFTEGRYSRGPLVATQSPAMDIQVASNFERLYFELSGRDAPETARAFQAFARGAELALPAPAPRFSGRSVSEAETAEAIRDARRRYGVLIDPHTAVALAAVPTRAAAGGRPRVVLATAHPAKFPEAVTAATGERPELPEARSGVMSRTERFETAPNDLGAVTALLRRFARP